MSKLSLKRALLKLLYVFRVNEKRVFFSAYEGKQYSCNPKCIFEAMCKDEYFKDYEFIWEFNDPGLKSYVGDEYKDRITNYFSHNSFGYFKSLLTSGIVITNSGVTGAVPIRKRQINLNTWHGGGAFKRVGFANESTVDDKKSLIMSSKQTTYYVSSSRIFTSVQKDSVLLDEDRFIKTGMPRNDVFFDSAMQKKITDSIRSKYDIDDDKYIVLYAPTYRGAVGVDEFSGISFDLKRLGEAIEERFGKKMKFLYRTHYFNANEVDYDDVQSVSDYPDMQELLVASDMLITDYSSSMWDFSLTGKPCMLYVDDLDKYQDERGFYTPIASWPGIVCRNTEELAVNINKFDDDEYQKKIESYLAASGSYDRGDACNSILTILKENKD